MEEVKDYELEKDEQTIGCEGDSTPTFFHIKEVLNKRLHKIINEEIDKILCESKTCVEFNGEMYNWSYNYVKAIPFVYMKGMVLCGSNFDEKEMHEDLLTKYLISANGHDVNDFCFPNSVYLNYGKVNAMFPNFNRYIDKLLNTQSCLLGRIFNIENNCILGFDFKVKKDVLGHICYLLVEKGALPTDMNRIYVNFGSTTAPIADILNK